MILDWGERRREQRAEEGVEEEEGTAVSLSPSLWFSRVFLV